MLGLNINVRRQIVINAKSDALPWLAANTQLRLSERVRCLRDVATELTELPQTNSSLSRVDSLSESQRAAGRLHPHTKPTGDTRSASDAQGSLRETKIVFPKLTGLVAQVGVADAADRPNVASGKTTERAVSGAPLVGGSRR